MKHILKPILLGIISLTWFSCNKDIAPKSNDLIKGAEPTHFTMQSSLGSVQIEQLGNNGAGVQDDDLRANINFNGISAKPTTSLSKDFFGIRMNGTALKVYSGTPKHKINARWGIIHGNNNTAFALNCAAAQTTELPAGTTPPATGVMALLNAGEGISINQASVKMYCTADVKPSTIKYGYMCFDGVEAPSNKTRQYFNDSFVDNGTTYNCKTNPNERIQGLTATDKVTTDRHIPIMTDVVAFDKFSNPTASTQENFKPRGVAYGTLH